MTAGQPGHYLVSADPGYLILPSLRDCILGQIVLGERFSTNLHLHFVKGLLIVN